MSSCNDKEKCMQQWILTEFEAHMLSVILNGYIEAQSKEAKPDQWLIELADRLAWIDGAHADLLLTTLPKRPVNP